MSTMPTHDDQPVVVGVYGVPGSGKTTLLGILKTRLGEEHFLFFDGSKIIEGLVSGGIDEFKKMSENERINYRGLAIDKIALQCRENGKTGVVAGHFMFWDETTGTDKCVWTDRDQRHYTHVLYLDIHPDNVIKRRQNDTKRNRPNISSVNLRKWQNSEKSGLRKICYDNNILFSLVQDDVNKVTILLRDFREHTERSNLAQALGKVDESIQMRNDKPETMLVFDADKTLAADDTGALFWAKIPGRDNELTKVFDSNMGYSYNAFRQAMLMYEELTEENFESLCTEIVSKITLHPELARLLVLATNQKHVGAVVVTAGLSWIWRKVLHKYGLSDTVPVIGGGRIADGYVVTADVKRDVVTRLQDTHNIYVWAFGDSKLDLGMLRRADQAVVVVGEEHTRSKSMEDALKEAIQRDGLRARQMLLPNTVSPRLNTNMLPLVESANLASEALLPHRFSILHATDKTAAKLLATPMRDKNVAGPALREAHRQAGWYLAVEHLSRAIGVEQYEIAHVQNTTTSGHRLRDETRKTMIVPLMRGGEPMAIGVNDAFPLATFLHAKTPSDIKALHLEDLSTIVLVDSVINSGKTIVDFVHYIRKLHKSVRIAIVAGVLQAGAIGRNGTLTKPLEGYENISLISLRISENKYTGKGTTDTGARLFNTTHLE